MPTWTAKQISDLNNSMVAAQNVSLGTVLGAAVGKTVATGVATPTGARYPVSTGLTSVTAVVCSLAGSPTLNCMFATAIAGSVAGDILIYSYSPTNASTVTPVAASTGFINVGWIAIGA